MSDSGRDERYACRVQRTVDAPVATVYEAFASARGLDGWFTSGATVDFRVGGSYRTADGDAGTYLRIEPNRLVRFSWENPKHTPGSVVTVRLVPRDADRTTVVVDHGRIGLAEERDGLRGAWRWALGSLAAYVTTGKGLNA